MATLTDILSRHPAYRGIRWTLGDGDDYTTLLWYGPGKAPSEAEIRSHGGEVDDLLTLEARARAAEEGAFGQPGRLLAALGRFADLHEAVYSVLTAEQQAAIEAAHPGLVGECRAMRAMLRRAAGIE
ncbi:MAG: hypothetical protein KDB39_12690 [Austwickia sp.]|nr:hypothetical protein [Austwickia sp.]